MRGILVVVLALTVSSGCGETRAQPAPSQEAAPAYQPVTNVRQTMVWILDPATDVIWDSAGTIITAEGRTELAPTTDEGWAHVRNAAAIVAETGNLLMMPGRAAGPDWIAYAQALNAAGKQAIDAAEAQDSDALFEAGGQLYQACLGCHRQFMLPPEDAPNDQ